MKEQSNDYQEHDDPAMMPITDAWWNHLLDVFRGKPPHPRSWYSMPACPDWGPRSTTRFEPRQSLSTQEGSMSHEKMSEVLIQHVMSEPAQNQESYFDESLQDEPLTEQEMQAVLPIVRQALVSAQEMETV